MFFTVRDHTGTLQFLANPDGEEVFEKATSLRMEVCCALPQG